MLHQLLNQCCFNIVHRKNIANCTLSDCCNNIYFFFLGGGVTICHMVKNSNINPIIAHSLCNQCQGTINVGLSILHIRSKIYDPCVFRVIDSSDFKGIECNVTSTLGRRLPHCSNVDRTLHTVEPPQKRVYLGESRVRTGLNHCFLVIRFDAVKISDICDR